MKGAALIRFLIRQRVRGFDPPSDVPHLDPETTDLLTSMLRRASHYLEFGAGGSTVLADRLKVKTVTVESDRFYAKAVRSVLSADTSVCILTPRIGLTREWGTPIFHQPRKWRRYIVAPFAAEMDSFPDLVLVDGRFRLACVLETARQAYQRKEGPTIILDDYEDRPYYHIIERYFDVKRIGRSAIIEHAEANISPSTVEEFAKDYR